MSIKTQKTESNNESPHTFHIPVLGTGFSIDTPLKVAKYGISSVISLVDDVLIEQVRKFWCEKSGEPYSEISNKDEDARAKRITAYLNLVDKLVEKQVQDLQASPFEKGSEITRYYEMLPECPQKDLYNEMLQTEDEGRKAELETSLRKKAVPGSIDVNIMTKLDCSHYSNGDTLPREYNDAMAALRGYGESTLKSAIVFSAGINKHLYSYVASFKDFFADKKSEIKKKVILKVSDYRSAVTQGKMLAKKGLWVSEFRIESGLNCGGHAFASKGLLLGPILEEFKKKKDELVEMLHGVYSKARESLHLDPVAEPHNMKVTVQGGICTSEEDTFLKNRYSVDGTGWGTPFLLVPDCVNVDDDSLEKLSKAGRNDTQLSKASPVGIPYWNLVTSESEQGRIKRVEEGKPGTPCPKGYILFNTEFTERPICTASKPYQKAKLEELSQNNELTVEQKDKIRKDVLAKNCICHELGGSTTRKLHITESIKPNICPGPIIGYFSKTAKLEEMVGHIYGRLSLLSETDRPHMFAEEMKIYFEHLADEVERLRIGISDHTPKYLQEFKENLLNTIAEYNELASEFVEEHRTRFQNDLADLKEKIETINPLPQTT